jgi:hypothetical protein
VLDSGNASYIGKWLLVVRNVSTVKIILDIYFTNAVYGDVYNLLESFVVHTAGAATK